MLILLAMVSSAQITISGVVPPIIRIIPIDSRCEDVYANIQVNVYTQEGNSICPVLQHCKVCSDGPITTGINE
jgi:hypothetical protein